VRKGLQRGLECSNRMEHGICHSKRAEALRLAGGVAGQTKRRCGGTGQRMGPCCSLTPGLLCMMMRSGRCQSDVRRVLSDQMKRFRVAGNCCWTGMMHGSSLSHGFLSEPFLAVMEDLFSAGQHVGLRGRGGTSFECCLVSLLVHACGHLL
jgi:hypothetical protein